jgi:hypothetical protein
MAKKTCRTCNVNKHILKFSIDRSTKDQLDIHCRECKKRTLQTLIRTYPPVQIDVTAQKYCYLCKSTRKVSDFYKNKHKKSGISTECIDCSKQKNTIRYSKNRTSYLVKMKETYQKRKHIISAQNKKLRKTNPNYFKNMKLREFGITLYDYNEMLLKQKNACAICCFPEKIIDNRTNKIRSLAVDHCHITKKVRGLLCTACNQGLGNMRESFTILRSASNYLRKHAEGKCHSP